MLFGHQNDDSNQQQPVVGNDIQPASSTVGVNPLAVDSDTGVSLPVAPEELTHEGSETSVEPTVLNQPDSTPDFSAPVSPTAPVTDNSSTDDVLNTTQDDDLLLLKQHALEQLSPLVGHLEQSPEEKFRTTMMMIQASDDKTMVKPAYEAAQAITDEKVRAQALLDIVNEINYFTQHQQS